VVDIGHQGRVLGPAQRADGELKGLVEALVCDILVVVDILGHNAHNQLIQRVFDAFAVERGHDDALSSGASGRVDIWWWGSHGPLSPNNHRHRASSPHSTQLRIMIFQLPLC
jgi:hypothetical protein